MKLRTQVFLGGLLIALLSAAFTGLLIRNRTIDAVDDAARANLDTDQLIFSELFFVGIDDGGWNEVQDQVDLLSATYDRRIAIVDLKGVTIADSAPGQPLPKESASFLDFGFSLSTDEDFFGEDSNLFCSDLLEAEESGAFEACMESFDEFLESAENEFDPDVVEVDGVFLYLGFPAEVLVDRGTFSLGTLASIGGLVLVVAALLAGLIAGPMTKPVGELTAAVHRLTEGDLSMRVDGSGNSEVAELANGFNGLAERLEYSDKARRQMVSDVAHELRNPVGVMQSNLEAAQDGLFPTDSALVELLHSETLHLGTIIADLSQLAQSDAGELSVELVIADLNQIATEVIEVASPAALASGVSFSISGGPALCLADPNRVRQVIANLVSNAVRHSPAGGTITLTTNADGSGAWLEVADQGDGLTQAEADRVFDRFWRSDSARVASTGGAGLGLAICRSLIEAQNGTIEAASGAGGGRFRFFLPASPVGR